jgi:predicted Rossmann-fold nucleotide-binding protein
MPSPLHIACIGSRSTPPVILDWMRRAGALLVRAGHHIVSGNAPGADQAWAAGANTVDPAKVTLCLPWEGFEHQAVHARNGVATLGSLKTADRHYYETAAATHPAWSQMTPGAQRLHARNAMIVDRADIVLGWTDGRTGGTKVTFALAQLKGIPVRTVHADDDALVLVRKMVRR